MQSPSVKLLILDVDGVLTRGDLPYDGESQGVVKVFHVQDGGAVRLWQSTGGRTAMISGRRSPALERRAADIGVEFVRQGVVDKLPAYEEACRSAGVAESEVAYVGDDFVDLPPMRRCGYPIAVQNAASSIKRVARYVTRRNGGEGAVTEAIERLLRHNGTWSQAIARWQRVGTP